MRACSCSLSWRRRATLPLRVTSAFGDLYSWRDAKVQVFSATYDKLSRLTSRVEPGMYSTFTWGNSAGSNNIGRLANQYSTDINYREDYFYDSIGRPSQTRIT